MDLFSAKPNCDICNKFELTLHGLYEDFNKHMNAPIIQVVNSHLAKLYSPTKEPAVVFFRHGVPLLYNGIFFHILVNSILSSNKVF